MAWVCSWDTKETQPSHKASKTKTNGAVKVLLVWGLFSWGCFVSPWKCIVTNMGLFCVSVEMHCDKPGAITVTVTVEVKWQIKALRCEQNRTSVRHTGDVHPLGVLTMESAVRGMTEHY